MQSNVVINDGYVPDTEVERYFAAADLVVLPYTFATQSGIVQIVYGFEKPVVVTNVGGLPDVVENERTGYIIERGNEKQIAEAIVSFFLLDNTEKFTENIRDKSKEFAWEMLVSRIEKLVSDD